MKTKHTVALRLKGKLRANLTFLKPSILLALMNECIEDILLTSLPTEGETDRNTKAKKKQRTCGTEIHIIQMLLEARILCKM